jgi:hypothetical protein
MNFNTLNVEKISFSYNFTKLQYILKKYTTNNKIINDFISFLESEIMYGAFTKKNIFNNSCYDFIVSAELYKNLNSYLNKTEKLLTEDAYEYISNIDNIGIIIDSDYDTYEKNIVNDLTLNKHIDIQLAPTFCLFEKYSEKLESLFSSVPEFKDFEWSLYNDIESFEKEFTKKYIKDFDYQYGGNLLFPTQHEYDNFLGSYYGEYGDCGSIYVSVIDNELYHSIDMF